MAIERAQALVIEDSPEITLLVRGLLEKEGYSVVATPRGIQGLEWARAKKPELVILDLSLPDRDGVEVCQIIGHGPIRYRPSATDPRAMRAMAASVPGR